MGNAEKYDAAFATGLNIDPSEVNETLAFESIPAWDSIGQMVLISTIEESFGIEFNPDDILNFKSYENGKTILSQSYGIEF